MGVAGTTYDAKEVAPYLKCAPSKTTATLRRALAGVERAMLPNWREWGPSPYHAAIAFDAAARQHARLSAGDHAKYIQTLIDLIEQRIAT